MGNNEYLKSVEIENKVKEQIKFLESKEGFSLPKFFSNDKIKLTKKEKDIILSILVFNEEFYYYSRDERVKKSDHYNKLMEVFENNNYKDSKYKNVFYYLFGKDCYEDVMTMLDDIEDLPYGDGYTRRSFRYKGELERKVKKKIFAVGKLNSTLIYELPILEYLKYNEINLYNSFEIFLSAKIKNGDNDILNQLIDVAYNRHESIKISRTIIKILLLSGKPEAFKALEDLLLAAQRSEGLRQSILESLDETNLEAQKYFMKVIIDNKLTRFSSVVRAFDVWCGLGLDAQKEATVTRLMKLGLSFLENVNEAYSGVNSVDNSEIYMALWAIGTIDIMQCVPVLKELLKRPETEKAMIAIYFLNETGLFEQMKDIFELGLFNEKLEVFAMAANLIKKDYYNGDLKVFSQDKKLEHFNLIEKRIENVPEKGMKIDGKIFDWHVFTISREFLYMKMINLLNFEDEEFYKRMFVYFNEMPSNARQYFSNSYLNKFDVYSWEEKPKNMIPTPAQRDFAFLSIGDKNESCRNNAEAIIKKLQPTEEEYIIIEDLLKTNNNTFRKILVQILNKNTNQGIKQSIERLLEKKSKQYKMAALSMLTYLKMKNVEVEWVEKKANEYKENNKITSDEEIILNNILESESSSLMYTFENGLGLYDPSVDSGFAKPEKPDLPSDYFSFSVKDSEICKQIKILNEILVENKNYEYESENKWTKEKMKLILGNDYRELKPSEDLKTNEEKASNFPLIELWRKWFLESKITAKDLYIFNIGYRYLIKNNDPKFKTKKIYLDLLNWGDFSSIQNILKSKTYYGNSVLKNILDSLELSFPFEEKEIFLENLLKAVCSQVDEEILSYTNKEYSRIEYWFNIPPIGIHLREYENLMDKTLSDERFSEFWKIKMFLIRTVPKVKETPFKFLMVNNVGFILRAFTLNLITEDEFINGILEPTALRLLQYGTLNHGKRTNYFEKYDFLEGYIKKISERILEIELKRGDASTPATTVAEELMYVKGMETYAKILTALGNLDLFSGYQYSWNGEKDKKQMLSFLLKHCEKLENENQDDFDRIVKKYNISSKKLIESAVYSTSWVPFVANHLKISDFAPAVWWIHAHTNGANNKVNESEIGKYSKVPLEDFREGAVDVDWFKDIYKKLGEKMWNEIYKCGKYSSQGNGHTRAKLYADAILGKVDKKETWEKIKDKRNQDQLRIYGVIPLSKGAKAREKDILERYRNIESFKKESKQFGSQRQASEKLAEKIAMENLSRTGGYADPIRLTWAMETKNTIDIFKNAKDFSVDDITVALKTDESGKTFLECFKSGKLLKSVPTKYAKNPKIVELKEFSKELNTQQRRVIKALEESMINRDTFTIDEIKNIMINPVIKPVLQNLVLKTNDGLGFWGNDCILDKDGKKLDDTSEILIAHCTDLYSSGQWGYYQSFVFDKGLKQSFKQIFRELYVPTEDELFSKTISRRYEGYQVSPKMTVALLKSCGWKINYDTGLQKVFYKDNVIATVYALADWFTPADVESPTLETIEFYTKKDEKPLEFSQIPPVIFSEVMRDLDMVVSVAHVGDVDPEASHSTIEMRTSLVKETVRLFGFKNVEINGSHVIIKGSMGEYSVHLGSGIAHKILGTSLNIIPVHSQHRGNLFLPFFDEDPKSAEIISKIILLAEDEKIVDPTILRQM